MLSFFLLLSAAFLHKQIIGMGVRYVLSSRLHCELAYRSINWEEGQLVLSDVVLFDPSFDAHIERAAIEFDWSAFPQKIKGHLQIDRPHVSLLKKREMPEWKGGGWFDFTIAMQEGVVEWGGPASFALDYTREESYLHLDWGDSGIEVILAGEKIEADLRRFRAALFKPFIEVGDIQGGLLSGRVQMGLDQKIMAANLKLEQFGISVPLGGVEGVDGSLSYHANLGAKWQLQGTGVAQDEKIPFVCEGRGFFKSRWIESEIVFEKAFCKISGEETWKVECRDLQSAHVTLLQAPLASLWPEWRAWSFLHGSVSGEAIFSPHVWNVRFAGKDLRVKKGDLELNCHSAKGNLTQDGGELTVKADDFEACLDGTWGDWKGEARVLTSHFAVRGGWDGEKFPIQIQKGMMGDFQFFGQGWVDPQFDLSFALEGEWAFAQGKIPFYCSHLDKQGKAWSFDFRFARKTWDLLRLAGLYRDQEIAFDPKSHLLGAPLQFAPTEWGTLDASVQLPWKAVLAAAPFLRDWGIDLDQCPVLGETHLHVHHSPQKTKIEAQGTTAAFHLQAERIDDAWHIDLASALALKGSLFADGRVKGSADWKGALQCDFEGQITPSFQGEFTLPRVWCDLEPFDFHGMKGTLEGRGKLSYRGEIESEFDFSTSSLQINNQPVENEGPLHLSYASAQGARFEGVDLHGPLNCKVDQLEYDAVRAHWLFHNAQVDMPGSFLTHRYLRFLDRDRDLHFTADLDFASDFSTFTCTMAEGDIPFDQELRHIENLHLFWSHNEGKAAFRYENELYRVRCSIDDKITGRLILGEEEEPMTVDWEYEDELAIHSIEGEFAGVDASFHAENPNTLIGSARLNFTALAPFLPPDVAQVFTELKMGKGYELKGRLKLEKNRPSFTGILAGKQLELFGFQFRTLMAHVALGAEEIDLTDLKISDTAGVMKIDAIHLEGKNEQPWTISIPQLTLVDLRPSLLQRPGEEVGPISPLVVRELQLTDFQGLLDRSETYTAKGKLHFINSYKREETVFDIPANVLSRIVGIDLDLLIPVRGDLTFDLKEGVFHLHELTNAYSEGDRSEFFLEMDPSPTMDLDGNLQIFIKMKQFVLLKITESFLISVEGKLNDPEFHLQKKRFFGLM